MIISMHYDNGNYKPEIHYHETYLMCSPKNLQCNSKVVITMMH